jgi:hypothetical protein
MTTPFVVLAANTGTGHRLVAVVSKRWLYWEWCVVSLPDMTMVKRRRALNRNSAAAEAVDCVHSLVGGPRPIP